MRKQLGKGPRLLHNPDKIMLTYGLRAPYLRTLMPVAESIMLPLRGLRGIERSSLRAWKEEWRERRGGNEVFDSERPE